MFNQEDSKMIGILLGVFLDIFNNSLSIMDDDEMVN